MRRTIATVLLPLAALSGCASLGVQGSSPGRTLAETKGGIARAEALRVRAMDTRDGLTVSLNRPAHTAIFEIVPGEGVVLLSPDVGMRSILPSGHSRVLPTARGLVSRNRLWRYDDVRTARYGFASAWQAGPRHLMVVASEHPLELRRFAGSAGVLRRALGTARYSSMNSRRVMDDVIAAVVPAQMDETWDMDVVTVWPDNAPRIPAGQLYRVRCGNGALVWVPLELAEAACRHPRAVAPPADGDSIRTPGDSSEVRTPGGRRPKPEGETTDEQAKRQRIADLRDRLEAERRGRGVPAWVQSGWQAASPAHRGDVFVPPVPRASEAARLRRSEEARVNDRPRADEPHRSEPSRPSGSGGRDAAPPRERGADPVRTSTEP